MRGKGGVIGIERGLLAVGARVYHCGFAVVDHDILRNAAKICEGVVVSGEPKLQGFTEAEFEIEHSAIAQSHGEKR
jgi:hypothetical protein